METPKTLWIEVNELAKEKYGKNYPSKEANDWVTETYESRGGSWGTQAVGELRKQSAAWSFGRI
tara:strand:- start:116 stop:307 length:192 start_codon:yes stop_codon:yes gene_type:complete